MTDHEALIAKLDQSAIGERALGNHDAAAAFEAKAEELRSKYNLPKPSAPVKEPAKVPPRRPDYWDNFPGVPPRQEPLAPQQLDDLRRRAQAQPVQEEQQKEKQQWIFLE